MDEAQEETAPHLAQKESSRASEVLASFRRHEGHKLPCGLAQGAPSGEARVF